MGVVIPIGYAEVTQEFLLAGKVSPMVVVTGHSCDPGQTPESIAANVRSAWEGDWGWPGGQPSSWTLGKATARKRIDAGTVLIGEDPTTTTGGGSTQDSMPINCALLIRKVTGIAGRKFRGRMYVPGFGVPDGSVSIDGTLSSGTRNGAQAAIDDWLATIAATDNNLFLFHSDATAPTEVFSCPVEGRIATQRRRLR